MFFGRIPGRLGRSPGTSVFKAIRNRVTLQQCWISSCPSLRFWVCLPYRSKLPRSSIRFFQTVLQVKSRWYVESALSEDF